MTRSRLLAIVLLPTLIYPSPFALAQQTADSAKSSAKSSARSDGQLDGYSRAASETERNWEEKLRALPVPDTIRENMRRLSARPHHVGSPYDKDNAEWMLAKFKEWGFDAQIENFYVLFPTPKERLVELLDANGATKFKASLQEPVVPEDPTSNQTSEQLPTYNAYSADGDVTGPLVYVNYGTREDYEELDRLGVSVKGAVVIARYGGAWRGIKPKVAAEHGAVGCIIYSDPANDGYGVADSYPKGAGRPKDGVQRGGVNDTDFPGDPLTPGVGATKDAKRLDRKDSPIITKIPVLPISYADATPLLSALAGRVAPATWRGGLPITYHIGQGLGTSEAPSEAKVHLKMFSNWDIKTLYDVIAKIPGSTEPDEWVIRGNHHDAWVNGADDPISGASAELEEARSLGELLKQGWKPRRTIVYCVWDGEEPGLLGSTEWVETHIDELKKKGVMYLNSDSNGRGYVFLEGSHGLEHFINGVAADVKDPEKGISVLERRRLLEISRSKGSDRTEARNRQDLRISALGDGSDYVSFLDFAGIPSLDLGFGGEDRGSEYHSIYDDFWWYTHFADTDFVYGRALAQVAGSAVMRMADAELLPYNFANSAETISTYVDEVQKLLKSEQDEIAEKNKEIDEGVFTATSDPKNPIAAPKHEATPPFLNFAPLENGSTALTASAREYQKAVKAAEANGGAALDAATIDQVNQLLMQTERAYFSAAGLPGRTWFKHQLYAPGAYTGYGVKTLPAVREAIEQRKWSIAEASTVTVGKVLTGESAAIDAATEKLKSVAPSPVTPSDAGGAK
ncbi:M28 family metallopeptidase [Acidicapsa acidisoli]|uniref:M28 family metallopeptidase n=1 Tax=Acidicapsa acidisoli TaxID=1615681 RepID=UPI0021DFF7FE|nr:M28 family metallopeptidase [Acidicapsa acidisoli]